MGKNQNRQTSPKIDWVRQQLSNLALCDDGVAISGPDCCVAAHITDLTKPADNEYTGYRKPVVSLRVPIIFPQRGMKNFNDVEVQTSNRHVNNAASVIYSYARNDLLTLVQEEIDSYLKEISEKDSIPEDARAHTQAVTDRVQQRVHNHLTTSVIDKAITRAELAQLYCLLSSQMPNDQRETGDRFLQQSLRIAEEMINVSGVQHRQNKYDELPSLGHKSEAMDLELEELLRVLDTLYVMASQQDALRLKDFALVKEPKKRPHFGPIAKYEVSRALVNELVADLKKHDPHLITCINPGAHWDVPKKEDKKPEATPQ